jgi:UDPglucose 6-dehydrogenase
MNITVIGAGYVGFITGICFANLKYKVTILDVDKEKISKINKKISPFYEKNLDSLLKSIEIKATTDYSKAITDADVIFICVGTPIKEDNSLDLSYVLDACKRLIEFMKKNQLVVIKSTVTPGTTENEIIPFLEKHSGLKEGKAFHLAVNPEFLREGTAVDDFQNPDRIIVGCRNQKVKKIFEKLYDDFSCPKMFTDPATAEMIKYASNCFLATKVSFINEIGNICKKINVDVYDVAEGMGYDKRIGRSFLNAGAGWGGSCLPKDVKALITKAKELGVKPIILESILEVNDRQPFKIIELLKKHHQDLKGKDIGILGGAFKQGTDDTRESKAIPVIRELLKEQAVVKIYDPQAEKNLKKLFSQVKYCSAEEVLDSQAVLILTGWKEFENLEYKGKLVIDGRKINQAKKESQTYEGVCW